jgi:P4 family phage/plasmid primase-like protien
MNGRDRARLFMLAAVGSKADGVPGMGRRSLYGPEGLLIPCRDTQGRIVALCIRRDAAGKGPKYVWLSSAQHGGPSPGAPCHVPADIRQPVPRVRIAEGTLKSDVAYSLSGLATIGVAGVGNLKTLVDTLKQLGAETAVLSFDSDAAENLAVATALQKAHKLLVAAGFQVEMERWAAEDGKGIDDLLAAGKVPDLLTGEDVAAEIKTIAQQAGAELLGIKGDGEENEPSLVAVVAEDILKTERFAQDGGGKLYRYAGGVYKPRAEEVIRQHAKRFCVVNELTKKWSIRFSKEVIEFIRVDSPILWERPPVEIVNVQNGLLRVIGDKRKLLPHSPDHLSPIQIPVAFNPAEECPNIDRFVSTTFPADAHDLAWEMVGWLMTPTTWLKKAVLLTGDGDNGKSVWLSLIVRFIGRQNVSTVSLHELEANKFKKARLVGKLANICADLPSEHLAGTSVFKQLTGGDTVEAERKFQEGFDVDLYARLIFSANHPPRSADSSGAFFRRWLVVPFDRTFAPEEQIPRDVLDAQLQDPAELSGLLNRALDGLARVQHQRGFSEPESVQAAWRDFHATTDPLAVWLDRYTLDAPELVCPGAVLRTAYNAAAEREGRPGLTDTAFGRAVRKQRPNVDYKQRTVSGRLQWCWLGIGLAGDDSRGSQGSQGFPSLFQSHAREPGEEG